VPPPAPPAAPPPDPPPLPPPEPPPVPPLPEEQLDANINAAIVATQQSHVVFIVFEIPSFEARAG
jgi:hypothetical protein